MSDSIIPAYADTRKIFQQGEIISGNLSLNRLPRFSKILANDQGLVSIELKFTFGEAKERLIVGSLQAQVNVFCQRCLMPLSIALSDDIALALVRDEEAALRLDAKLDPWICEDHKLDLAELIEEQLILCTPIVSYHESGECMARKDYVAGENSIESTASESPFAVLRSLKDSEKND